MKLRRRLRLQIYGTIVASLLAVVVITAILWNLFEIDRPDRDVFQMAARLTALTLPETGAPVVQQVAAVKRLGNELDIDITHAKISTLGEKIDDIFYLTTPDGKAITDQALLERLEQNLVDALEARKAA